jgi:hypothetical protein
VALRLEPADEYMHETGPEPNFNESMYFNFYDPGKGTGGFFRLGNRPNETIGEMTACLWLPDGSVAFMFDRPQVTTNAEFRAAGMRFEVVEPFEKLEVTYDGPVLLLADPLVLSDPRSTFTTAPRGTCTVGLTYDGISAMFGGEPDTPGERPGEEFARGHYEQLVRASGSVAVEGQSVDVTGYGLRDHSWGPRYWQAPWYYRWLTANFGEDFGFMGSRIARRDGDGVRSGFVWDGDRMHICDSVRVSTEWDLERGYQRVVNAELVSGDTTLRATGRVLSHVPLRNRRRDPSGKELLTRICEGLTEWSLDDGRVGYGLSEYLDQVVDGSPVGLGE